jgi:hypothetical protein
MQERHASSIVLAGVQGVASATVLYVNAAQPLLCHAALEPPAVGILWLHLIMGCSCT